MRAPRFPLKLVVHYREVGARDWHIGTTENISRSGVLVRADGPVQLDVPLELRMQILASAHPSEAGEIWCRGRVVRTVAAECDDAGSEYAVAIDQYDLLPAGFLTH